MIIYRQLTNYDKLDPTNFIYKSNSVRHSESNNKNSGFLNKAFHMDELLEMRNKVTILGKLENLVILYNEFLYRAKFRI